MIETQIKLRKIIYNFLNENYKYTWKVEHANRNKEEEYRTVDFETPNVKIIMDDKNIEIVFKARISDAYMSDKKGFTIASW